LTEQLEESRNHLISVVFSWKQSLKAAEQLIQVPCVFCEQETLDKHQERAVLRAYMHEIAKSGFHCSKKDHAKRLHDIVGNLRWSCCENNAFAED